MEVASLKDTDRAEGDREGDREARWRGEGRREEREGNRERIHKQERAD